MTFAQKVVLVAGGTGGLGRAVTLAFLGQDARVAVTYRNTEELETLKAAAGARQTSPIPPAPSGPRTS